MYQEKNSSEITGNSGNQCHLIFYSELPKSLFLLSLLSVGLCDTLCSFTKKRKESIAIISFML